MPCTDFKPTRVKLSSHRFTKSHIVRSWDYDKGTSTFDQAESILAELGFTAVGGGETKNGYVIAVEEFCALNESPAEWRGLHGRKVA